MIYRSMRGDQWPVKCFFARQDGTGTYDITIDAGIGENVELHGKPVCSSDNDRGCVIHNGEEARRAKKT